MLRKSVLLVSKRAPERCATHHLFSSAGVSVKTATNLQTAAAIGSVLPFHAVVVCRGSFGDSQQDQFVHDLKRMTPDVEFIVGCPGCTTRDDLCAPRGVLNNPESLEETLPEATGKSNIECPAAG